jgi:hypothetical protein
LLQLPVPNAFGADYHGERLEEVTHRPKAPLLSPEAQEADNLLLKTLDELPELEWKKLTEYLIQLKKFPDVLKYRTPEILTALIKQERFHDAPQAFCLELLASTVNPELITVFEGYLKTRDREGEVRFPAAAGLGAIYKKHPEFLTKERRQILFDILIERDDNDLARLYLRQKLPSDLARELDEQVYEWQKARRPRNALAKVTQKTKEEAHGMATYEGGNVARRALAFQALLEIESPTRKSVSNINLFLKQVVASANQKPEQIRIDDSLLSEPVKDKLNEFVERIERSPVGLGLNIHDGIQIESLLTAARRKGIELDPTAVKSVRELTQKQFEVIWNGGNFLVKQGGDSNLSNYAHAALMVSQGNSPLSPTLTEAMERFHALRKERNPETGLPKLYNYTSESYRTDATEASSAGRAITSQLAFYQRASGGDRPQEAQELLKASNNFDKHFSQLFEWANYFRTHDRNPSGEGMATYYGFGNVPYAAEALVHLKAEPNLTESQRQNVRSLANKIQNRLLNLMRFEDRFTDRPDYNLLAIIALKKLDSAFGPAEPK